MAMNQPWKRSVIRGNKRLPDTEKLKVIYQLYLNEILSKHLTDNSSVSIKYENMASMIVDFYGEVQKKIVEINRPHYAFSPHDLTNWCYNLFRYTNLLNESFDESFMEAVCYEAKRIFTDKLASESEKSLTDGILKKYLSQVWPNDTTIVSRIETVCFINDDTSIQSDIPLWGTLLMKLSLHDWKLNVEKYVERYENENGHCFNLPLFNELLQLTSKINRIVTKPGGSVILAGRTGVGRKTAVKIAAYMQSARCIFISDNVQQFKIDMKSAMQTAGIEREPTYLLLEEHILKCSFVKNVLNTLISTGETVDLYSTTELETIVSGLREQLEQDGFEGSLTEYFHHRVNEQLHIIVTLDVTNEDFIKFYDEYPELLSKCSTIWIDSWSLSTMQDMPHLIISMKRQEDIDYTMIEAPNGFETIHLNVPNDIQTPGRFITFINTYLKILYKKKKMILEKGDKLKAGVSKLVDAKQLVETLKVEAQEREKELAERQAKANEALEKITMTMKNAHSHKDELQSLKEKREDENKSIMQRKKAIEIELAEVEPLIQEARAAVGNIRSESLYEIRSLRAPPDVIRDILEGVLRLMGILDTSWNSMKMFLAKRGVKEEIRSFDASFISSENRQAVEKLLNARKESFEPKNAKRASVAAAPLAAWVNANVKYAKVLEKIRPLEKEQQQLQRNLQDAEEQILHLSSDLTDVDATVAKLQVQLNIYSREAAETEVKLKAATETLTSSQGLVSKLDDEFNRWQEQLADISKEINIIPIKSLLAAAFIIYLSNEMEGRRRQYLQNWQKELEFNQNFSIEEFLSTEKEQLLWQSENLPVDKLSIQNAVIIQETWLYSLLIDPSSVAVEWIRNHFKSKSVEITNQENPKFLSTLELSIRFGKILIIEEVNSIHPILYTILRKNFVQQGSRKLISLSGRLIDFHNNFKLFFASRNPSLSITSAISSFLSVINFTTTLSGLSGQLIVSTLQQERTDLETSRRELSQKKETLQFKLEVLQDNLLEELANAHGDILENKELLMSLNETKLNSAEVARALKESANLHQQLSDECDVYKPLADFGSNLYFAILEINRFNPLYQFSVSSYKKLFLKILQSLQVDEMSNIDKNRRFLQLVYQYVARGLFKDDRLLFALHLAHKMIPQEIPDDEWELFTRQETAIGKLNVAHAKDHVPNWLPDNRVQEVFLLQVALPNLYSSLRLADSAIWSKFMQHTDCENNIPSDLSHKLTLFQQLLVVQALRPDRLFSAVSKCAAKLIGLRNLNQSIINLSQVCNEATETEPILLISSGGIDPSLEIRELAEKIIPNKFIEISMSNAETPSAILALSKAASEGYWLCLKNLHLVVEWLPILCQKIKEITTFHSNFRLWLTTETHPHFSPVLSQSSIHIAYEAPQGVKQNLLRIYDQWLNNPKIIVHKEQSQQQLQNRILFSLACIHAIVQERRNFIPQGWSTYYEFNNGDLSTAQQLILHILKHTGINIEWPVIRGLTSTSVYGGKIDSQQDDRVLQTYMQQYLNENILSHLWKPLDLSGVPHGNVQEYITFIGKLSDVDLPSYFGLPDNIHRIWEINAGATIVSQLKILALSNLTSSKFNISLWQSKLSPLLNLWKKLNQNHDWVHTKITNNKLITNTVTPFEYYIQNEYSFSLNLMQFIHKCLIDISKILRNVILPNNDLLNIGNCLINSKVPDSWHKEWEGPLEPFAYIRAVIKRTEHIVQWKNNIERLDIFKVPIDLANLFHPETFLATLKEYTAKKKDVTTENLRLSCDWSESKTSALSVMIENLQLEGGTFDKNILSFCKPDSPSVSTAINCQIEWILDNEDISYTNSLQIPLYYSITRQRHLANLYITINESVNTWIQTGIAFHLQ